MKQNNATELNPLNESADEQLLFCGLCMNHLHDGNHTYDPEHEVWICENFDESE